MDNQVDLSWGLHLHVCKTGFAILTLPPKLVFFSHLLAKSHSSLVCFPHPSHFHVLCFFCTNTQYRLPSLAVLDWFHSASLFGRFGSDWLVIPVWEFARNIIKPSYETVETPQPNCWNPTTKFLKSETKLLKNRNKLWRPAKVNARRGERRRLCLDEVGDCWSVRRRQVRLACPRTWENERRSAHRRARAARRAGEKDKNGRNPKGHDYPNIARLGGIVWMEEREAMPNKRTP